MFLRITQTGESVPALVPLWCADKRLFARVRWTRTVVFLQSCDRSQCCDFTTLVHGSSQKVIRIVLRVRHTFSNCVFLSSPLFLFICENARHRMLWESGRVGLTPAKIQQCRTPPKPQNPKNPNPPTPTLGLNPKAGTKFGPKKKKAHEESVPK